MIPEISRDSREYKPQISHSLPVSFFNSRSLPVKWECDFQFPFPFPGAKKPFPPTPDVDQHQFYFLGNAKSQSLMIKGGLVKYFAIINSSAKVQEKFFFQLSLSADPWSHIICCPGYFFGKNVNDDCEVTPASIRPTSTDLRLFNHELIFWYAIRHTVTILRYAILRPDVKWLWSLESAKIPPMRYLTISSNEVFSLKKVEWSRISWHKWRFKACSCKFTDGCRSL